MIEIITGTFGYYNGRKVIPITNADGPQTFDPELEERLVRKGVARYVYVMSPQDLDEFTDELPEYNEDMKLEELKEIAKVYGVDVSNMRRKSDIIEAIEAARAESTDDAEQPPQIDAAELV